MGSELSLRYISSVNSLSNIRSNTRLLKILKILKETPWKKQPFSKQNWGHSLHHMSPYVGKMKPAIAHVLIDLLSKPGDTVLDPFCGIGTVPLEADLMERKGVGIDLNPYAFTITRAKFERLPLEKQIDWLKNVSLDTDSVDISKISDFVKQFYNINTLKEMIALRDILIQEKRFFLLGALLGILHGHRPGHLSATTSLVIPFKPKTTPEYRAVIPRVIEKVKRLYKDDVPMNSKGRAIFADSRNIPLNKNEVDVIITSPPYFDTLDYVQDNRLRLEFLGLNEYKRDELKHNLIQNRNTYIEDMIQVGYNLKRVLKPGGVCIFVLGDMNLSDKKTVNTARVVSKAYESLGFSTFGITSDLMPINKAIPSVYKRRKLDRFLVMINNK